MSDDLQKLKAESPAVKTYAAMDSGDASLYFHPISNTKMIHPESGQAFTFDGNFLVAVEESAKKWLDEEVLSPATLVIEATKEEFEAYKEKLKGLIAHSWPSLFSEEDPVATTPVEPVALVPVEEPAPGPTAVTKKEDNSQLPI